MTKYIRPIVRYDELYFEALNQPGSYVIAFGRYSLRSEYLRQVTDYFDILRKRFDVEMSFSADCYKPDGSFELPFRVSETMNHNSLDM